jgi:hypothetical protein
METKVCIRCHLPKPISEFYSHPKMADGTLGKCKPCCRTQARERFRNKRDEIRDYETTRARTERRRRLKRQYRKNYRAAHPEKNRCHAVVSKAVRDGRLIKHPCEVCGSATVQAHHSDYSKPLEVIWLCLKHHRLADGTAIIV